MAAVAIAHRASHHMHVGDPDSRAGVVELAGGYRHGVVVPPSTVCAQEGGTRRWRPVARLGEPVATGAGGGECPQRPSAAARPRGGGSRAGGGQASGMGACGDGAHAGGGLAAHGERWL